jgi:hypothetical protein
MLMWGLEKLEILQDKIWWAGSSEADFKVAAGVNNRDNTLLTNQRQFYEPWQMSMMELLLRCLSLWTWCAYALTRSSL